MGYPDISEYVLRQSEPPYNTFKGEKDRREMLNNKRTHLHFIFYYIHQYAKEINQSKAGRNSFNSKPS
jgi:hypothetical protein